MLSDACHRRLEWDFQNLANPLFEKQWEGYRPRATIHPIDPQQPTWLEIGAGTGGFFESLAGSHPQVSFVALERDRYRGKTLEKRARRSGLPNFRGIRTNAVPWILHGVPDQSLSRVYILYPCPWPKPSDRKNRWYLHPLMETLMRKLRAGGSVIWASDQRFYIEEAEYASRRKLGLESVRCGALAPHPLNMLEFFPKGRTKFESEFLRSGHSCYELIAIKH